MRTKKGIVTSAKMQGTVAVSVRRLVFHPLYKKRFPQSKKFLADMNGHDLFEGDVVRITECRPLSKNKYFKVTEILQQAPRVGELQDEAEVEKSLNREKSAPVVEEKKTAEKTEKNAPETEAKTDDSATSESDA